MQSMIKKSGKLTLKKVTIRELQDQQMLLIAGGGTIHPIRPGTANSCRGCTRLAAPDLEQL